MFITVKLSFYMELSNNFRIDLTYNGYSVNQQHYRFKESLLS